jgi:hypothetical protein
MANRAFSCARVALPARLELDDDDAMAAFVKSMPSMATASEADVARLVRTIRNLNAQRVTPDVAVAERHLRRGPRVFPANAAMPASDTPGRRRRRLRRGSGWTSPGA